MKKHYEIREAVLSDADKISLLVTTLSGKYIAPSCTSGGVKILLGSMTSDAIKRYILEGYKYYVALEDSDIVGAIGMKDNSEIYHLFVSEFNQGQGLSRKLWEAARDECMASGNEGFFTVKSAVNAKNVYLRFGFSPIGNMTENLGIKEIPMELRF